MKSNLALFCIFLFDEIMFFLNKKNIHNSFHCYSMLKRIL